MELNLINENNEALNSINVPDSLFDRSYNESVVHQLVVAYLANARGVNSAQKDRSQVSKSTRKPWKQKGTGRARVGTAASPLWRGGGQIFPNNAKENYSHKVNRKMYRAGISIIYSQLIRDNRLLVVDSLVVSNPKTKTLALKLENLSLKYVLIITEKIDENLYLSSRNLPRVKVVEPGSADPYDLLKYKKVLVTKAAIKKIQGLMT